MIANLEDMHSLAFLEDDSLAFLEEICTRWPLLEDLAALAL